MKGRDALREMLGSTPTETHAVLPRRSSGAIRAMSLELQQLSEDAAAAKSLRERLADSEPVVEIAPSVIDPSPVSDRIAVDRDLAFEELKAAIAENGQQVPILVRPHPETTGRYQIAYGRRRLRAALELGKGVKAVVRRLTDRELVIAQAQENGNRADLSFIERALFAANLDGSGFDRDTITAALRIDKPELSRLLTVATTLTPSLIAAIGPAPKVGRPRWLSLAERCADVVSMAAATRASFSDEFAKADTNTRFGLVVRALDQSGTTPELRSALKQENGHRLAWLERSKRGVRISIDDASFAAFLEQKLPSLVRDFESAKTNLSQTRRKENRANR
jgi:ParB family transcriptional regulator, chromosome partitioning protein